MVGRRENDAAAVGATSSGGFLVATIIGVHATLQDRKTVRIVTDVALRLIKLGSLFVTYEVVDYVRDLYMLGALYRCSIDSGPVMPPVVCAEKCVFVLCA